MKFIRSLPESETFPAWSDRIEKWLRKSILTLIVLLIVSQAAMQSPMVRGWLSSTEHAEGIAWDKGPG